MLLILFLKINEIFLNAQRYLIQIFNIIFYFMPWDIGAFFTLPSHECCPTVFHCCCNLKFQRARIGDSLLLVYRAAARNRVVLLHDCQSFTITFTLEFSRAPNLIANKHSRPYVAMQIELWKVVEGLSCSVRIRNPDRIIA